MNAIRFGFGTKGKRFIPNGRSVRTNGRASRAIRGRAFADGDGICAGRTVICVVAPRPDVGRVDAEIAGHSRLELGDVDGIIILRAGGQIDDLTGRCNARIDRIDTAKAYRAQRASPRGGYVRRGDSGAGVVSRNSPGGIRDRLTAQRDSIPARYTGVDTQRHAPLTGHRCAVAHHEAVVGGNVVAIADREAGAPADIISGNAGLSASAERAGIGAADDIARTNTEAVRAANGAAGANRDRIQTLNIGVQTHRNPVQRRCGRNRIIANRD